MNEVVITAEELYYLAKACDGDHLNYDYILMIPDIQQGYSIFEENCILNLEKKRYLTETWGEIVIAEEIKQYLSPIWNGNFESVIYTYEVGKEQETRAVHIHVMDGSVRFVILCEQGLKILSADLQDIESFAYGLIPDGYDKKTTPGQLFIMDQEPESVFIFKNARCDRGTNSLETVYRINGWFCRIDEENKYRILSGQEFYSIALSMLRG